MPKTRVGPCSSVWEAWYCYVLLWVVLGGVDFRYHAEFIYISPLDQAATYLGYRRQGCEGTPLAVRLWSNTFVYVCAEADTQKSWRTQGHRTRTPCWISWLWSCLNLAESVGGADISERAVDYVHESTTSLPSSCGLNSLKELEIHLLHLIFCKGQVSLPDF